MNTLKTIDFSGLAALVVDPDPVFSKAMTAHLEAMGFSVFRGSNTAEAQLLLDERFYDLVVTEILLEYKDSGLVLCWKIKKKTPETKIVIVTGISLVSGIHFDLSSVEAKNWIQADSILDKEIRFEQFDHELHRLFR